MREANIWNLLKFHETRLLQEKSYQNKPEEYIKEEIDNLMSEWSDPEEEDSSFKDVEKKDGRYERASFNF